MQWHEKATPPSDFQMNNVGSRSWQDFVGHSERIVPSIYQEISKVLGEVAKDHKVLDFGCGVGRVAQKLWHDYSLPTHGCDVNADAIEYMKLQTSGLDLQTTSFNPPLPYEDAFFDVVYSISVWTHFSPEMQMPWLEEIHRILKPGGYALISISSESSFEIRQERLQGWKKYKKEDIKENGILFVEYPGFIKNPDAFPGIESAYGSTLLDFDYVRKVWGELFSSVQIKERKIDNSQDLIVLKK